MPPLSKPSCRAFQIALLVAISAASASAKNFAKPQAQSAQTYPAHDDHSDEKVAIAADPYDTPEKAKIFSINFHDHGFLPVFFIVTNNGDQPIAITGMQVTLTTANNSKLTPASPDDIYRRLVNPQGGTRPQMPLPFPRSKVKGAITDKERNEVESSQFAAHAVEPHNTQSGFLFFDIEDIDAPLAGAHLYVTGVDDAKGTELMYFDIPMDNYLNPPRKTNN
ncbi:MAG TPA: hypothetical protein VMF10_13215 [Candidatus Aquilonibacter sp.]|nr:hypothetical protein [Candidatus Aquilonibacter sp.]